MLFACTPNPGRAPLYPDATRIPDLGFHDAEPIVDALPADAGLADVPVGTPDYGPPPWYPFTGVFDIDGDQATLLAREIGSHLAVIVGSFPRVYIGTIEHDGDVDLGSPVQARSGCMTARLHGRYERISAFHVLSHHTCNAARDPVQADLRGGLLRDFDPGRSGVYELQATVMFNPATGPGGTPCFTGDPGPHTVRYGINFDLTGHSVFVFTAEDLIPDAAVYIGNFDASTDSFGATSRALASASGLDVTMSGRFEQVGVNDPPRLTGQRDVADPSRGCAFSVVLDGARASLF